MRDLVRVQQKLVELEDIKMKYKDEELDKLLMKVHDMLLQLIKMIK